MPLSKGYAVLKCKVVDRQLAKVQKTPHYQVRVRASNEDYRLAINVKSVQAPYDLLYFIDPNFKHPITDKLAKLDIGLHKLDSREQKPGGIALDYIRGNLFDVNQMKPLPYNVPGADNDLNDKIDFFIQQALHSNDAELYAFGEPWQDQGKADQYFPDINPSKGVHDIHMNQGNKGQFAKENGVYQDGGLLIHFPAKNEWVAFFFAFQSQAIHTQDDSAEPLPEGDRPDPIPTPVPVLVSSQIRIVAALVNPPGNDVSKESVTLINASPEKVDLNEWALADSLKRKHTLKGISLTPGAVVTVPLTGEEIQLGNEGGIITLLDNKGIKIDGVSYTKDDANKQGWTIVF